MLFLIKQYLKSWWYNCFPQKGSMNWMIRRLEKIAPLYKNMVITIQDGKIDIHCKPGKYTENITLSRGVNLRSHDALSRGEVSRDEPY